MSSAPRLTLDNSSILLTLAASLYYFALQPWAILARLIIFVLTLIFSRTQRTSRRQQSRPARAMATSRTLIESIELKTKRAVTIETTLSDENLTKCNAQFQSPLYCKLPKELRDYIYELSSTQSFSEQHSYKPNDYYYRPSHTARLKTYTSLLQTCRRVWLEANSLPMRQAELAFWFQRGPHDRHPEPGFRANLQNERDRYSRFFNSLTDRNLRNVSHIHLFMQMFQFDNGPAGTAFLPELVQKGFRPKRFTVTIRSSDWPNWESGQALSLRLDSVQKTLDSPSLGGVSEFALELESEARKADQLDAIIQQLSQLQGKPKLPDPRGQKRNRGCKFVFSGLSRTIHWERSPRINNEDHEAYNGMTALPLLVRTLTWRNKACDLPDPVPQAAHPVSSSMQGMFAPFNGQSRLLLPRTPAMMLRSRAQRERLRTGGWIVGRFPEKEDEVWTGSVRNASRWQDAERERFEQMVGDIEAERLLAEWATKGSLLKFEEQKF